MEFITDLDKLKCKTISNISIEDSYYGEAVNTLIRFTDNSCCLIKSSCYYEEVVVEPILKGDLEHNEDLLSLELITQEEFDKIRDARRYEESKKFKERELKQLKQLKQLKEKYET
jgi:hypothetical protein